MSNSDPTEKGGATAPPFSLKDLEDLQKATEKLSKDLATDAATAKLMADIIAKLIEAKKEPIKIEAGATNPRGWQDQPPTEAQVKSITRFKLQPLQGMTRGELAEIIDILKQHPPTGKRIIRDRGQDR